jgi:hypothetical protein
MSWSVERMGLCKDKGGPEGVATPNPALDQHTSQTGSASRA